MCVQWAVTQSKEGPCGRKYDHVKVIKCFPPLKGRASLWGNYTKIQFSNITLTAFSSLPAVMHFCRFFCIHMSLFKKQKEFTE